MTLSRFTTGPHHGDLLPRPFVVTSQWGIAWEVAHLLLKIPFAHESSVGLPLMVVWVAALVGAWLGVRWLVAPAALMGIVSVFWIAALHIGVEVPSDLTQLWPLLHDSPRLSIVIVYAALMAAGIVLGLVNIWTVRAALHAAGASRLAFALVVAALLLIGGLVTFAADVAKGSGSATSAILLRDVVVALVPGVLVAFPMRYPSRRVLL